MLSFYIVNPSVDAQFVCSKPFLWMLSLYIVNPSVDAQFVFETLALNHTFCNLVRCHSCQFAFRESIVLVTFRESIVLVTSSKGYIIKININFALSYNWSTLTNSWKLMLNPSTQTHTYEMHLYTGIIWKQIKERHLSIGLNHEQI